MLAQEHYVLASGQESGHTRRVALTQSVRTTRGGAYLHREPAGICGAAPPRLLSRALGLSLGAGKENVWEH